MSSHPYRRLHVPGSHPVAEHILVAEKALGKKLPEGAEVHHVNEIKKDNRPENLVVCPDHAYHMLLHKRTEALNACGNANWLKCWICKQHDAPENLSIVQRKGKVKGEVIYHKACNTAFGIQYRESKKVAA